MSFVFLFEKFPFLSLSHWLPEVTHTESPLRILLTLWNCDKVQNQGPGDEVSWKTEIKISLDFSFKMSLTCTKGIFVTMFKRRKIFNKYFLGIFQDECKNLAFCRTVNGAKFYLKDILISLALHSDTQYEHECMCDCSSASTSCAKCWQILRPLRVGLSLKSEWCPNC